MAVQEPDYGFNEDFHRQQDQFHHFKERHSVNDIVWAISIVWSQMRVITDLPGLYVTSTCYPLADEISGLTNKSVFHHIRIVCQRHGWNLAKLSFHQVLPWYCQEINSAELDAPPLVENTNKTHATLSQIEWNMLIALCRAADSAGLLSCFIQLLPEDYGRYFGNGTCNPESIPLAGK